MRIAFGATMLLLVSMVAAASQEVSCALEQGDRETVISVPSETDALAGAWSEMGRFRIRALLATPAARSPWLLVEVYAKAADGDDRIITSQKISAPFSTGRMEVVEPRLGRSFRYECRAAQ